MDSGDKATNLNLPPPVQLEMDATPQLTEAQSFAMPESAPAESKGAAAPPPNIPTVPQMPATPVNVLQTDATNTTSSSPAIADDNDLIEKEWVVKAKQIVEKTKDNPYVQNKEINVFKADYMKKRYNKTIKLSE